MAKNKNIFVPLACKKRLTKVRLYWIQGCGSPDKGLKKYGVYHAWYNAA
jgi:hypothetical protein